MFGGVAPQQWGDSNGVASSMSSDAEQMRTLFNRKLYPGANAMIAADVWMSYSSTNSRHTGVLMRIANANAIDTSWSVTFYYTSYGAWGEYASASLNGASTWTSAGANAGAQTSQTLNLTIPAGRTSTLIVVSASDAPSGPSRTNYLAFTGNSLTLPAGLTFVDDLDVASGNIWLQ